MIDLLKLAGAPVLAALLLAGCDDAEQTAEAPAEEPVEEAPSTAADVPPVIDEEPPSTAADAPPATDGDQDMAATTAPEAPADETTTAEDPAATADAAPETATPETGEPDTIEPAAGDATAGAAEIQPGSYTAGTVTLVLNEDNTFEISNTDNGETVTGNYELAGEKITLSNPTGAQETAEFPMECTVNAAGAGFEVTQSQDSCAMLDGLTFAPAG